MKMNVSFSSGLPEVQLTDHGFTPQLAAGADFWRIHLDTGSNRELTVFSTEQEPPTVQCSGKETVYTYTQLKAEDGQTFDVTFSLFVREENGGLTFVPQIENRDNVRVNEVQAPFLAFDRLNSEPEKEVLYIPNSLGERIENPRAMVQGCHTEYMSADYRNIWYTMTYPSPMTMAWLGVQSGDRFLYMARKDEQFRICCFCLGTSPRGTKPQLIFAISHYPMARKGETITCGETFVSALHDWRAGSADYREWANTWYHPSPKPQWVQHMTGWQRIIMKHQYGEIFFRYADLPQLYRDGAKCGLDTLLVFGWWKDGMDNGYPCYEPDEALGGADALRAAIAEVQRLGGRILLYSNGKLIDVKSDFYAKHGRDCCQMDIDGNEYREHYQFSNNGTVLRKFGYKSFVSGCQAAPEWREQLKQTTRVKLQFHPDSVFYDQIGGCLTRLCFNEHHEHGARADEEVLFRLRNMDELRAMLEPDQALGSENIVDVYSEKFDYLHGCCNGCWVGKNSYPYLFMCTFPETITTNRMLHDERSDYRRHYNNAFIFGLRFDLSVYRCRKVSVAALPNVSKHVKYLLDLRAQYGRFFYEGRMISAPDEVLPDGVRCTEYAYGAERMAAFSNNGSEPVSFVFRGQSVTVGGEDVACCLLPDAD